MSDTEDEDAEIRRPWTLGKRVRLAMRLKGWVGWGAQQKLCQASGIGRSYVSAILGDGEKMQNPSPETREKLSEALGVPPWAWQGTTDDQFQAALESVEQEGPARQLADYSGGKEESHALASFLTEGGAVEGALATDTVTLVIGKPEKAKMRHNARSNQKSKIEHISLSGVPLGAEIVLVKSRVELRDTDESLAPGYLLYVDRKGEPQSGRLVIAKRDIDPRLPAPDDDREKALADVRLFRYHKVGRGWSLEPIDGSGQNVGPGDGWVIVAAVLMWRSPP